MPSKSAKAAAIMQAVAMVKDYDQALTIFEALGKSFGPINKVLESHETERWMYFDAMDDAEFWEMIEDTAHVIDDIRKHFGESK